MVIKEKEAILAFKLSAAVKKTLGKDINSHAYQMMLLTLMEQHIFVPPAILEKVILVSLTTLLSEGKLILKSKIE